jgi:hypothetical protein
MVALLEEERSAHQMVGNCDEQRDRREQCEAIHH